MRLFSKIFAAFLMFSSPCSVLKVLSYRRKGLTSTLTDDTLEDASGLLAIEETGASEV